MGPADPFDILTEAIADRVAAKVIAKLSPPPPSRVLLADVKSHGAPSRQWVEDRARKKLIEIKGPRGARYVDAVDLERLITATSIRRAAKDDDGPTVDELAARLQKGKKS